MNAMTTTKQEAGRLVELMSLDSGRIKFSADADNGQYYLDLRADKHDDYDPDAFIWLVNYLYEQGFVCNEDDVLMDVWFGWTRCTVSRPTGVRHLHLVAATA